MQFKNILRDVALVFFFSYWGSFALGFVGAYFNYSFIHAVFLLVGYTCVLIALILIARWQKEKTAIHLATVATIVWLLGAAEHLPLALYKEWFVSGFVLYMLTFSSWRFSVLVEKIKKKHP